VTSTEQRNLLLCVLTVFLIGAVALAQEEILVRHLSSPDYPELARQAQIQGTVLVQASIAEDGTVVETNITGVSTAGDSGANLLKTEAEQNLRKWIFSRGERRRVSVTYEFRLQPPESDQHTVPDVEFDLPSHVVITSHRPQPIRDGVVIHPKKK